jgi:hypothetical protein
LFDVSQNIFRRSQETFRCIGDVWRQYWRLFSHNFSRLIAGVVSNASGLHKRRFSHLREMLCEKSEAPSQAGLDNQAKRFVRKASAFAFSLDSDKATKTLQSTQEKICEKSTYLLYRLSQLRKPIPTDAEKNFVREKRIIL